jgi:uncharacterized protein (TIGR00369 family)
MHLATDWVERGILEIVEETPERVEMLFHVTEEHLTPYQALHGGINGVLIETVASVGATLRAQPGQHPVGLSLSVKHTKSATVGETLRAVAVAVHAGKRIQFWKGTITNEAGEITSFGDLTLAFVRNRDAS